MTKPLTLDQITYEADHYGVKVVGLADTNEFAAFTHDQRRAYAAVHRYIRDDLDSGPVFELVAGDPEWWAIVDNCGCGEKCTHRPESDGYTDHDCKHFGLPPCTQEELAWIGKKCEPGTPGAVPVITVEASY